jgi:hypothetical protein
MAVIDAASLELARCSVGARGDIAFGGRSLFATRSEASAVGRACLSTPIEAVGNEANTLTARHANFTPCGARAQPTPYTIPISAGGTGDGRDGVVDLSVAVVVNAVALFLGRDAARIGRSFGGIGESGVVPPGVTRIGLFVGDVGGSVNVDAQVARALEALGVQTRPRTPHQPGRQAR